MAMGQRAFQKRLPRLARCYRTHKGHGSFKITSKILRNGKVADVRLVPQTIRATPFGGCVVKVAMAVRYPAHDADYVHFTQPVKIGSGN